MIDENAPQIEIRTKTHFNFSYYVIITVFINAILSHGSESKRC